MYPHSAIWHFLWLAPSAVLAGTAVLMVRRGHLREFPVFFAYLLFQIFQTITLFTLNHMASVSAYQYWYAYWGSLVVSIALRFGIIYEVFLWVLQDYPTLHRTGRILLQVTAVIFVLVGIMVAWESPAQGTTALLSGIHVVDRTIAIVQCGLLFFLFAFSSYFHLSWKSHVVGIAAGFTLFSTVELSVAAYEIAIGPVMSSQIVLSFISMVAYNLCALIWLTYFLRQESPEPLVATLPDHNLEEWNNELARLLYR